LVATGDLKSRDGIIAGYVLTADDWKLIGGDANFARALGRPRTIALRPNDWPASQVFVENVTLDVAELDRWIKGNIPRGRPRGATSNPGDQQLLKKADKLVRTGKAGNQSEALRMVLKDTELTEVDQRRAFERLRKKFGSFAREPGK
jgi:hypothetical protein